MTIFPESMINSIDHGLEYVYSWEEIASKTVVFVPPFMNNWEIYGMQKIIASFFLTYPLACIMIVMPFGNARYIYSIISGLFLLQWGAGPVWLFSLVSSLIVYGIMVICTKFNPMGDRLQSYRLMKWLVCPFVLIAVNILHAHKMYTGYNTQREYGILIQMGLTQKLWKLVYNIYDGYVLATMNNNNSDNNNNNSNDKDKEELEVAKKLEEFALKDGNIPSLLEYFGYIYCFSTVFIVGPTYEFTVYRNACDGSLFNLPSSQEKKDGVAMEPKRKIPSNILPTLKPLLQSVVLHYASWGIYYQYAYDSVFDEDFLKYSFLYRIYYEYMAGMPYRFDFYLPWKITEGANNLWYAGFDGYDPITGEEKGWTNALSVDIYFLEFSVNGSVMSQRWNIHTSNWLKRYIYYRQNGSLIATYFVSALWHGFYPLFYLMGAAAYISQLCERLGRRKITPLFWYDDAPKWKVYLYQILSIIFYHSCFLYFGYPAFWRRLEPALLFWKTHYYYGHILGILYIIIVPLMPDPDPAKYPVTKPPPFFPTSSAMKRMKKKTTTTTTTTDKPKEE